MGASGPAGTVKSKRPPADTAAPRRTLSEIDAGSAVVTETPAFDGEIAGPMVLDHGEIHIAASEDAIGVDTVWHLDPADGSTVFRATVPAGAEWFPEMDDALVLEIGDDGIQEVAEVVSAALEIVCLVALQIKRVADAGGLDGDLRTTRLGRFDRHRHDDGDRISGIQSPLANRAGDSE